ncbi:RNA polymerase factor sigma-54 [Aneurinibacillus sp. Ricciae_BoGa-3]|uniref:RNA polymerase factor sigma-54 n=1 Tax=Aneurinibacillus sp. Ricciae_BoGa-3 TaxID=3022697 RepID=UPI0023415D16|nr:RNA polymerase factor sigma-54 [Aneurinibacillus sp. Ricciae_BoGa-3]WCK54123.1 RNA polymerase factor sigma-54 [Aneurinibacillus sp. Ricciae_BoGa-3]
MQMGFGLYQQQTLKLVMTPELRQAITILQYSSVDLVDFLHQQASENPVLEITENDKNYLRETATTDQVAAAKPEIDWLEYARVRATGDTTYSSGATRRTDVEPLDFVRADDLTLERHLSEQIAIMKNLSKLERKILRFLIGNLNESGYLYIDAAEAASILDVPLEQMEDMITFLQGLDPVGVGSRNLVECLQLQILARADAPPLVYEIVTHYLQDVADRRFPKIASALGVTVQSVQEAADYIKSLNPRPAGQFGGSSPRFITPDVTVEKVGNEYVVIVTDSMTPNLSISRFYRQMLQDGDQAGAQRYIQEKLNSAMWLIKSIEQRRMTLYRVTQAIVEEQQAFFKSGITSLKPMTLKDIAQKVDLHESTISRATSNKYVQTPRGLFELKYFFTNGLGRSDGGDAASALSVKKKIKELIDSEDKNKPLSDQKIMDILVADGTQISRRTVAKYREELGIAGSSKRKRF